MHSCEQPGPVEAGLLSASGVLLRSRALACGTLFTNDAGRFVLHRVDAGHSAAGACGWTADPGFLAEGGLVPQDTLGSLAFRFAKARRRFVPGSLDYLIFVPTLRCNLACSYCQARKSTRLNSSH